MCFSASVSYSAAVLLAGAGGYALQQAGRLNSPYWRLWALVPVFFGIQQAFEGRVWQLLNAGEPTAALPFAFGFHFFSHFLWLWWLPLASYLVEPGRIRKRVFAGCTLVGAVLGILVFTVMLLHPEWMTVSIKEQAIKYRFSVPFRSSIHLPIKPAALYALVILVPLLFSSFKGLRVFGWLAALFSVLTSQFYGHAYISVWCFFAAVLSLYLVHMLRQLRARVPAG